MAFVFNLFSDLEDVSFFSRKTQHHFEQPGQRSQDLGIPSTSLTDPRTGRHVSPLPAGKPSPGEGSRALERMERGCRGHTCPPCTCAAVRGPSPARPAPLGIPGPSCTGPGAAPRAGERLSRAGTGTGRCSRGLGTCGQRCSVSPPRVTAGTPHSLTRGWFLEGLNKENPSDTRPQDERPSNFPLLSHLGHFATLHL